MHRLVVVFILFVTFLGYTQGTVNQIQKKIDKEVWRPFQKAFENLDGEALNTIYAEEVLRVTPEGIDTDNTFKFGNLKRFDKNKTDGISITLDFWFDSRHTNVTTSYEVGFYRIGFTDKTGSTNYSYGQFHIVLKKIDGHWKITQDWDTSSINGKPISAVDLENKDFLRF